MWFSLENCFWLNLTWYESVPHHLESIWTKTSVFTKIGFLEKLKSVETTDKTWILWDIVFDPFELGLNLFHTNWSRSGPKIWYPQTLEFLKKIEWFRLMRKCEFSVNLFMTPSNMTWICFKPFRVDLDQIIQFEIFGIFKKLGKCWH